MTHSSESSLDRKWTVHLIQHTHTDVGYTESQSRIARFHVDFIDRVIDIDKKIKAGDTGLAGFKWTNECFWSIEQWIKKNPGRTDELVDCIRNGTLGLTAGYLHFNELIDGSMLAKAIGRAVAFARQHDLKLDTAIAADINGFSWGYAGILHDAGVVNLMTCVHAHHGLAPIGKRQTPFYWETPDGRDILVWNGEHYHHGNSLGLVPGALNTYGFRDELQPPPRSNDHPAIARIRLPRYLKQLELDHYPYDFIPIHVSGAMTDNAPPSAAIARFVNEWNACGDRAVHMEMSTPSDFCAKVRAQDVSIPRYRGDWPDWWSDGLASTPDEVRLLRQANRNRTWLTQLAETRNLSVDAETLGQLEQNILLFTEHTFNHSDSMKAPWNISVKAIGGNKKAIAYAAFDRAMDLRDDLLGQLGELGNLAPPDAGDRFIYRVLNPLDTPVTDLARLYIEHRDFDLIQVAPEVVDLQTGETMDAQQSPAPRGFTIDTPVTLGAKEEAFFELRAGTSTLRHVRRDFSDSLDGCDVQGGEVNGATVNIGPRSVETESLHLTFAEDGAILSWTDKSSGEDLLSSNRHHAPFTPVYDVTPVSGNRGADMTAARRVMGRNRKGEHVRRHTGTPGAFRITDAEGPCIPVELDCEVEGCELYQVTLSIWKSLPRVDVTVRLHKKSVWAPENLYVALPFAVPGGTLWVDKAGGPMRPWVDQLPDTLTDWVCLQEGFCVCGDSLGVAVTLPDAPLLQLGPLDYGTRRLMGHPDLDPSMIRPYNWLMTNYWETNFDADLGGFHEFTYRIESGGHLSNPRDAVRQCRILNHGLKPFRIQSAPVSPLAPTVRCSGGKTGA
ncbi:MAG: glycoside hydrolase [Kiritimatiellia bacterium]